MSTTLSLWPVRTVYIFFQAEDGIRDLTVTGVQTCALPILDWGKVQFFLGEVFANFTRNAAMQLTAIGTVAVTIVMLGSFLYVRETLTTFGQGILKQIEIAVYLDDSATDQQSKALATTLARDERISS